MHIGGVRTALYAWMWARKHGGTFILRIEDTDKEREVPGSIEHIMETLRWLGLEWDYGPDKPGNFGSCIQSERLDTYRTAAQQLVDKGLAYPDPYSAEEIDGFRRAAQADKRVFLFRDHRPKEFGAWDGTRPLRFKVPEVKRSHWHDAVRGELQAGEEALDDFILMKSDGYPTYNFAHIIDDQHMGITHIMRADEFISSTPKFLSLYEALGITPPVFVTLPPILREDKTKKLGKRDGAKDVLEYRAEGYLPEAMINFLALIGWNPGTPQEIFSREELIAAFDISGIHSHGGVFNEEKLRWFNKQHLSRLSNERFKEIIITPMVSSTTTAYYDTHQASHSTDAFVIDSKHADIWNKLTPIIRERIATAADFSAELNSGEYSYFFAPPKTTQIKTELLPNKSSSLTEALGYLQDARNLLAKADFSSADTLKSALWDYATEKGRGNVLWPLRYALTGKEKSPDPFTVAHIIGKEDTLARIDAALTLGL